MQRKSSSGNSRTAKDRNAKEYWWIDDYRIGSQEKCRLPPVADRRYNYPQNYLIRKGRKSRTLRGWSVFYHIR